MRHCWSGAVVCGWWIPLLRPDSGHRRERESGPGKAERLCKCKCIFTAMKLPATWPQNRGDEKGGGRRRWWRSQVASVTSCLLLTRAFDNVIWFCGLQVQMCRLPPRLWSAKGARICGRTRTTKFCAERQNIREFCHLLAACHLHFSDCVSCSVLSLLCPCPCPVLVIYVPQSLCVGVLLTATVAVCGSTPPPPSW